MATASLVCKITGSKYTFNENYYNKKAEEYGGVDNLQNFFVTKKAKNLISRGYNVREIRNILQIEDNEFLLEKDSKEVKNTISFHLAKDKKANKNLTTQYLFSYKSDPDVAVFINNIKNSSHEQKN